MQCNEFFKENNEKNFTGEKHPLVAFTDFSISRRLTFQNDDEILRVISKLDEREAWGLFEIKSTDFRNVTNFGNDNDFSVRTSAQRKRSRYVVFVMLLKPVLFTIVDNLPATCSPRSGTRIRNPRPRR